jgi:hypothetical protein
LTTNIDRKANPLHINFHELFDIIRDVKTARTLREKLFYVFGDPGDVADYKKGIAPALDPKEPQRRFDQQHVISPSDVT